jgi:hypothetical protein
VTEARRGRKPLSLVTERGKNTYERIGAMRSSETRRRTMTVMRADMNWPMAEIIKKVSDQNLRGGCVRKRRVRIVQRDSQAIVDWVRTANAINSEYE